MTDHRETTKGLPVRINFGGTHYTNKAGAPGFMDLNDGMLALSGEIKTADGDFFHAILEIDSTSSGEHWGTIIVLPDGALVAQDDGDFLELLGKTKEQVFPYSYRYFPLPGLYLEDHHVDPATGWS